MQSKVDFIQLAMANSVVELSRSSKALPKAKLAPKKRTWSLFAGLLSVWSTRAFWILEKPLHARRMLRKSMRSTINCSACSQHWGTKKGSILLHDKAPPQVTQLMLQKSEELGNEVLPHPSYSPDLSPTDYHFFKHLDNFLQIKCFHNQQDAENSEFFESQSMHFYTTGANKLISHWQKCVDCNGSYFD